MKEKLSVIATITKVSNFQAALEYTKKIYSVQGAGHSVGLHSVEEKRMLACAMELPTSRVIVNQAHSFGTECPTMAYLFRYQWAVVAGVKTRFPKT